MRIYLDSCMVIYLLEGQKTLRAAVDSALRTYCDQEICASELVRLECRTGPMKQAKRELLKVYDDFFATISILQPSKNIFERATEIRSRHTIKTPDALHLAFALDAGCDEFWTNDARLTGLAESVTFRIIP